jgi:hypothetical protein
MENVALRQCSRAITALKHVEGFAPERKAKLEELAIDTFVKNMPTDPKLVGALSCINCGGLMSALHSQCGNRVRVCVGTGRPIIDESRWECPACKHCVMIDLIDDLSVCTVCRRLITS